MAVREGFRGQFIRPTPIVIAGKPAEVVVVPYEQYTSYRIYGTEDDNPASYRAIDVFPEGRRRSLYDRGDFCHQTARPDSVDFLPPGYTLDELVFRPPRPQSQPPTEQ